MRQRLRSNGADPDFASLFRCAQPRFGLKRYSRLTATLRQSRHPINCAGRLNVAPTLPCRRGMVDILDTIPQRHAARLPDLR